jgi:putative transposase
MASMECGNRGFGNTVRDETDFAQHVDYIHYNPVKHCLVTSVRDWRYSSFHQYVRRGLLPSDWGGDVKDGRGDFGERRA